MEISFYAACLASYNAGKLHGAWIEATSDAEAMQEDIDRMLKASPTPGAEEWAVHDYDDETGIFRDMGEHPSLDNIAEAVKAVETICISTGARLQDYDSMRGRECIALHCH